MHRFSALQRTVIALCVLFLTILAHISLCGCNPCVPPSGLPPLDSPNDIDVVAPGAGTALSLLQAGDHVVEFGAGSGHLGLLLASMRPDCSVTLCEIKEFTCAFARERVAALGLTNCNVFCGSVDGFAASGQPFQCAVGLHCCGLLTDSVLELSASRRAAVCLVPCCYGQLVSGEDHGRGGMTAPNMHPRSSAFRDALGNAGLEAFRAVVKAADFNVVKKGAFDLASQGFATAQQCMRLVDTDRLMWLREREAADGIASGQVGGGPGEVGGGALPNIALSRLEPVTCSPKSSVLLVDYRAPLSGACAAAPAFSAAAGEAGAGLGGGGAHAVAARRRVWLCLFGGQGAVGGQMRELRRVCEDQTGADE